MSISAGVARRSARAGLQSRLWCFAERVLDHLLVELAIKYRAGQALPCKGKKFQLRWRGDEGPTVVFLKDISGGGLVPAERSPNSVWPSGIFPPAQRAVFWFPPNATFLLVADSI